MDLLGKVQLLDSTDTLRLTATPGGDVSRSRNAKNVQTSSSESCEDIDSKADELADEMSRVLSSDTSRSLKVSSKSKRVNEQEQSGVAALMDRFGEDFLAAPSDLRSPPGEEKGRGDHVTHAANKHGSITVKSAAGTTSESDALRRELAAQEELIAKYQRDNERLYKQTESWRKERRLAADQTTSDVHRLRAALAALEERHADLERQLTGVRAERDALSDRCRHLFSVEKTNAQLTTEVVRLREAATSEVPPDGAAGAAALEAKASRVLRDNTLLREQVASLTSRLEMRDAQRVQTPTTLEPTIVPDQNDEKDAEIARLTGRLSVLSTEVGELRADAERRSNELEATVSHRVAQLTAELSDERAQLRARLDWYASNQTHLDELAPLLADRSSEIAELRERLARAADEAETAKRARAELEAVRKQLSSANELLRKRLPPDSVPMLMWAAAANEEADRPTVVVETKKGATTKYLESHVARLQEQLHDRDQASQLSLRGMQQRFAALQLQYERRIESLQSELRQARLATPAKHDARVKMLETELARQQTVHNERVGALRDEIRRLADQGKQHNNADDVNDDDDRGDFIGEARRFVSFGGGGSSHAGSPAKGTPSKGTASRTTPVNGTPGKATPSKGGPSLRASTNEADRSRAERSFREHELRAEISQLRDQIGAERGRVSGVFVDGEGLSDVKEEQFAALKREVEILRADKKKLQTEIKSIKAARKPLYHVPPRKAAKPTTAPPSNERPYVPADFTTNAVSRDVASLRQQNASLEEQLRLLTAELGAAKEGEAAKMAAVSSRSAEALAAKEAELQSQLQKLQAELKQQADLRIEAESKLHQANTNNNASREPPPPPKEQPHVEHYLREITTLQQRLSTTESQMNEVRARALAIELDRDKGRLRCSQLEDRLSHLLAELESARSQAPPDRQTLDRVTRRLDAMQAERKRRMDEMQTILASVNGQTLPAAMSGTMNGVTPDVAFWKEQLRRKNEEVASFRAQLDTMLSMVNELKAKVLPTS